MRKRKGGQPRGKYPLEFKPKAVRLVRSPAAVPASRIMGQLMEYGKQEATSPLQSARFELRVNGREFRFNRRFRQDNGCHCSQFFPLAAREHIAQLLAQYVLLNLAGAGAR